MENNKLNNILSITQIITNVLSFLLFIFAIITLSISLDSLNYQKKGYSINVSYSTKSNFDFGSDPPDYQENIAYKFIGYERYEDYLNIPIFIKNYSSSPIYLDPRLFITLKQEGLEKYDGGSKMFKLQNERIKINENEMYLIDLIIKKGEDNFTDELFFRKENLNIEAIINIDDIVKKRSKKIYLGKLMYYLDLMDIRNLPPPIIPNSGQQVEMQKEAIYKYIFIPTEGVIFSETGSF